MYDYRPVGPADLELICRQRRQMFRDSGRTEPVLEAMEAPFRAWFAPRLAAGDYFGWMAEAKGVPVGGLGMIEIDWAPHPNHPTQDRRGYILNVFVEPEHRGLGIAGTLMKLAEDEGRRRGLDFLALHATDKGRPLYEKRGWAAGREMVMFLR